MLKILVTVFTSPVFYWIVGSLAASGILLWITSFFVASYIVYKRTLTRENGDKWSREMPAEIDPEQIPMYEAGCVWSEKNAEYKTDVSVTRDGLTLRGEYYDFGSKKCVMVLSGRTESLRYGYYFAIPYAERGYNVLVLDPRGHGLSEGTYNTVGFEESLDDIEWVKMLVNEYGIESVVFHGICIGAAGGMLAITNKDCPSEVDGIVTEGMYPNFGESLKNHLIEKKRSVFPTFALVDAWMKHYTGHSMKNGPIDVIDRLEKPLLMLHSREDKYSTPEYAQKLYDKAGWDDKRLVWFEHGRHSMLRITDTQRYDSSIGEFLMHLESRADIKI